MKRFSELSEREILALAIDVEDDDHRVYAAFSDDLRDRYPGTAKLFAEMSNSEAAHREALLERFHEKFGQVLPPIHRADVYGFMKRRPIWLVRNLPIDQVRHEVELREIESYNFYVMAATQSQDPIVKKLLASLAEAEKNHEVMAEGIETEFLAETRRIEEAAQRRNFVLQYVQPGLAGLMDGAISTLAPLFAAAFATHNMTSTFLVGLAASIGAGISMAFAEALSDDGTISGRGSPWVRGPVCGVMTIIGGLGHTLPYLIPSTYPNAFSIATVLAGMIVFVELWAIAWVRTYYMETPFLKVISQVVVSGVIVLLAGILIGNI